MNIKCDHMNCDHRTALKRKLIDVIRESADSVNVYEARVILNEINMELEESALKTLSAREAIDARVIAQSRYRF